jgi:hypothetical protein
LKSRWIWFGSWVSQENFCGISCKRFRDRKRW